MFVAVYRWRLRPGSEAQFAADWRVGTLVARERYGSGGSALFKAADGTWVAVARWPDRESRGAFFTRTHYDADLRARQAEAVLEDLTDPAYELELVDDQWTALPCS